MYFKYLYLFLMVGFLSCNPAEKSKRKQLKKFGKQETIITIGSPLKLSRDAAAIIGNWKEYKNFKKMFNQYQTTTPSEALSNAEELNALALQLKDSIKNKTLKTIPFKARLDVLQNETMRLQDMVSISNLKPSDIKEQVNKVLAAYNATIAKLNNIAVQKQIEKELDNMVKDSVTDSIKVSDKKYKSLHLKEKFKK